MKLASAFAYLIFGVLVLPCTADETRLAPTRASEQATALGAYRHIDDASQPAPSVDQRSNLAPNGTALHDNEVPHLAHIIGANEWKQVAPAVAGSSFDRHARAGHPQELSLLARLTYGLNYRGYKVGGGLTPRINSNGRHLHRDEGTFGVDFNPWYSRVALLRSDGRLYQGGTGQYEQDHRNHPFHQTVR